MFSVRALNEFNIEMFRIGYDERMSPHFSVAFQNGEKYLFHVDSTIKREKRNWFGLITHAHSDHYGQRNMKRGNAIASRETSSILEAVTGEEFNGITFEPGSRIDGELEFVATHPTQHMHGASAFSWETDEGVKILVTGDVKKFKTLPECNILITEATYGHPKYIFRDEYPRILAAIEEHGSVSFGAYPIGKAQKVVEYLISNGYEVGAEEKIVNICKRLMGDIRGLNYDGDVMVVSPRTLRSIKGRKYILTAQPFYRMPRIVVSDHLDFLGLLKMIQHCRPDVVVFYHGNPSGHLVNFLKKESIEAITLNQLPKKNWKEL
jgi:putative mRNA 3-end processing factor